MTSPPPSGILLIDKPAGLSSFAVVARVRKQTGQAKVGHAGTLDPFATGLLVLLLGRAWTKKAGEFLNHDKEYEAVVRLGVGTDSYDLDGAVVATSDISPSYTDLVAAIAAFQGSYAQVPPMFSAKRVDGRRLYELARKGLCVERQPVLVRVQILLLSYEYPHVRLAVTCSKGTYIRSLAHDIGEKLACHAHVVALRRKRSGVFRLEDASPLGPGLSEKVNAEGVW